jgi:hypothetical protein
MASPRAVGWPWCTVRTLRPCSPRRRPPVRTAPRSGSAACCRIRRCRGSRGSGATRSRWSRAWWPGGPAERARGSIVACGRRPRVRRRRRGRRVQRLARRPAGLVRRGRRRAGSGADAGRRRACAKRRGGNAARQPRAPPLPRRSLLLPGYPASTVNRRIVTAYVLGVRDLIRHVTVVGAEAGNGGEASAV